MTDLTLPLDDTEGTTHTVGRWFKAVGDRVELNDPVLEITTDKVTVEIAAPAAGVLREILKAEGESVEPGEVLGRLATESPAAAPPPSPGPESAADAPNAAGTVPDQLTPAVRRLLNQHGLDPSQVQGTGKGGRITVEDVERAAAGGAAAPGAAEPAVRRVPHTVMRKSIAEHMVRSMAAAPHVTSVFEADCTAIVGHRTAHLAEYAAARVKLTLTAYLVRATVEAIRAVPEANSRWREDALEIWEDVNLGIATALPGGGLIVPVLHRADRLDLRATAAGLADLTTRARAGKLTPRDVQGGTFTISNHGVSGSLLAAPIVINQPQSAILGVGKLQERPVVRSGAIVARPMAYVTLTIDHRVLDGFSANAFLTRWVEVLEGWRE